MNQGGLLRLQTLQQEKSDGRVPGPPEWEKVSGRGLSRRNFGVGFADNTARYESFFLFSRLWMGEKLLWQLISFRLTVAAVFGATV